MRATFFLTSALAASVSAAPAFPNFVPNVADNVRALANYFNLLASKTQAGRFTSPPVCDLNRVSLPAAASKLPSPSPGLKLKHIAIGRGTQNYTCDPSAPSEAPSAFGAVATLFDASCLVATQPDVAAALGRAALYFALAQSEAEGRLVPAATVAAAARSGLHYFSDPTTPFFGVGRVGDFFGKKDAAAPAPAGAFKGLQGEGAVPWLKLVAKQPGAGSLQEVYRVETVGGSAPATCEGMPESFTVEYATQYWFYGK
ncbi:hypothetical protein VTJ83DRAFT_3376 [Remersonia thermophila]|uniref:Malate dehydrogenase n=1 Tax=Remersonia thermophila TaxID=72144 RepID=A0ABR4DEH6_9PEZI